ncbi:MAG: phosphatidylglycerol lysyltransferase domain-containing protein [Clostridiales bacterium]|nr:phosphatidylglycerol lysyltransferase domain-containing protein [Clostridiales bacterium]
MLEFKPVSIEDKEMAEKYLKIKNTRMCEHCFTDLYIWSKYFGTELCFAEDFLFIKSGENTESPHYLVPIGAEKVSHGLGILLDYAKQNEKNYPIFGISEEIKSEMEAGMPNRFDFYEMRDKADYIYHAKDLITLSGKKLHSKRNFINRFMNQNEGRYRFCEISDDNLKEVVEFHKKWCYDNGCNQDEGLIGEKCAVILGLSHRKELQLLTGVLYLNEKIIAYSFGTQMSEDTVDIQIEKADHTIDGAYPMINRLFAERHCQNVEYINREEDLGLEGLRKSKLSYNPAFLLTKYKAVPKE